MAKIIFNVEITQADAFDKNAYLIYLADKKGVPTEVSNTIDPKEKTVTAKQSEIQAAGGAVAYVNSLSLAEGEVIFGVTDDSNADTVPTDDVTITYQSTITTVTPLTDAQRIEIVLEARAKEEQEAYNSNYAEKVKEDALAAVTVPSEDSGSVV